MLSRFADWLRDPETLKTGLHVMLTAVMGWLSLALTLSGDTLSDPSFAAFALLATEPQWSALFAVAALVGLLGLLSRPRWIRLLSIGGLSTAHGSIAYLFYLSHHLIPSAPLSTGTGLYLLIAATGYLLLWVRIFEQ